MDVTFQTDSRLHVHVDTHVHVHVPSIFPFLILLEQVPLLDANVLDQLCLPHDLWAKLDVADPQTGMCVH